MKTILKSKQTSAILGVLALIVIVALSPHASAQQSGISLGPPYGSPQPADQNAIFAWSAGIAIIVVMSGIGVWSAVRKHA